MPEKMGKLEDFTPEENHNLQAWLSDPTDLNPRNFFRSIGYAAGTGGWKTHEELEPSFGDKLAEQFGFETQKIKERNELVQKQQELMPVFKHLVSAKVQHMMAFDDWKKQQEYNTPTLEQARAQGMTQDMLPAAPGQVQEAPLVGPMPGKPIAPAPTAPDAMAFSQLPAQLDPNRPYVDQLNEARAMPAKFDEIGYDQATADFDRSARLHAEKAEPYFAEAPRTMQRMEQGSAKLDPAQRMKYDQLQRLELQHGRDLSPEQIHARGLVLDAETAKLERDQFQDDHPGEPVPRSIQARLGILEPPPGEVGTAMGATAQPSPLSLIKGMTANEHLAIQQQALQRFKEGRRETRLDKDVSQPVREWLAGEGLSMTPENIKTGRAVLDQRKREDEQDAIRLKEGLQTGTQGVRIQLARMGTNPVDASSAQLDEAIKRDADQELSVDARKKMQDFEYSGIGEEQQAKLLGLQQIARVTQRLRTEFTEKERREFVGYFTQPTERIKQLIQANPRFAKFDALVNREGIAAFETGGKALTAQESKIIFGFLPQGGEMSPENFEAKLIEGDDYARTKIHDIVNIATSNRKEIGKAMEKSLPKKAGKLSAEQRYNQLSQQGMKDSDIYSQMAVEGYQP